MRFCGATACGVGIVCNSFEAHMRAFRIHLHATPASELTNYRPMRSGSTTHTHYIVPKYNFHVVIKVLNTRMCDARVTVYLVFFSITRRHISASLVVVLVALSSALGDNVRLKIVSGLMLSIRPLT